MKQHILTLAALLTFPLSAIAQQTPAYTVETLPVEFMGITRPFVLWDSTTRQKDDLVRGPQGLLIKKDLGEGLEGRRQHKTINPNALPQGLDPALQTAPPLHGSSRAVDLSVAGMPYTSVNPADPCTEVGPNHVIQMINGGSGSYFRIYNKSLATLGAQTYLDNFTGSVGGAGDPVVLWDALADRWLMSEFSASGNRLLVAISQTADPLGAWYAYSYQATNFPDYPKYAVWNNCYVVTTNENDPAIYALPRANMLAGITGTAVRFTVSSYGVIGFQSTTPVTFDGGTAPPAGAPAMFMRMADDAWGAPADRLELWNINYNAATPASSTISGPTLLSTAAFDTGLCGYTSFSCMNQPGTSTQLDPLREVLMNRICYRNIAGYEAIVCSHVTDVTGGDVGGVRWYELHRVGGILNPWSIYQQGTYSPDNNDRWMSSIAINENGDIGLCYNVSGTTGGNVYPSIRYTGRYQADPLGQMTIAETTVIAGTASNSSNRWGDYNSLDVDPSDGLSFYGTSCYNAATTWSTRLYKFSFGALGCAAPTISQSIVDNCGAGTFTLSLTIGANGDSPDYDVYTSVNGGAQTFNSTRTPGTYVVGTYAYGTLVATQVRHNGNAACNQTLASITSNGTSCCTAPSAATSTTCIGSTDYSVNIDITSMGSATSIAIQIDADAGGPGLPTTVQTVTGIGIYGPFGPYVSGAPVNVVLVHNLFAQCNLVFNNVVRACNVPGAGCASFSNNTSTPLPDNVATVSTITVPSQGGATLSDLNVYVNISHTWTADVRIALKSPANTTVNLINAGKCTNSDNIIVEFDDAGSNGVVGTTCPMNNLYVIPDQLLSAFNGQLFQGVWTLTITDVATQDAGTLNSWCLMPALVSPTIALSPKVFLEGPFNGLAGTMSDALRTLPSFPLTEPYTAMGFANAGGGGSETTNAGVLAASSSTDAIVDWVRLELRSSLDPAVLVASRHALVQRDGDIVSANDGTSPVTFAVAASNYYVAVRHRNHLGAMTNGAIAISSAPVMVDFRSAGTLTYGTNARTSNGSNLLLWSGNTVRDTPPPVVLKYTGTLNDRDPILTAIGGTIPTATISGYHPTDVNMDGVVKYTGTANDRDPILVNIGGSIPTNTRIEQVP